MTQSMTQATQQAVGRLLQSAFAQQKQGQLQAAKALYSQVLAIDRRNFDALQLKGLCCLQAGEAEEALDLLDRALALKQDVASVFNHRGIALRRLGMPERALGDFSRVVALNPRFADAYYNRANTLRDLRRLGEAAEDYRRALALAPDRPEFVQNLAGCLKELGRAEEALGCYERLLALNPRHADAWVQKAALLLDLRRLKEAATSLDRALEIDPGEAEAWNTAGNLRMEVQQPEEALDCYDRAIALKPGHAEAHRNRGAALMELGRPAEAAASFAAALALKPGYGDARAGLARLALEEGRFAEAEERFAGVLRDEPGHPESLAGIAGVRRYAEGDPLFDRLKQRLAEGGLSGERQALLHHALGKIANDAGLHDEAMLAFARSKAVSQSRFDLAQHRASYAAMRELFTAEFFAARQDFGLADERPVFVVGMPRSGTTLTEQILASHARAEGLGELPDMARLARSLGGGPSQPARFADAVRAMTAADSRRLAERYCEAWRAAPPDALRLIDKRPHNYELLGLIALLFPRARIIHCRRDAVDTCLSMYMQHFSAGHGYNRELGVLGQYYRDYEALMAHWAGVLPLDLQDCVYEETVADVETAARALVSFLGLEWDPNCLDYHAQERTVRTPSLWQVRQPVYKSSVARWRRYEAHLGPLLEALGP